MSRFDLFYLTRDSCDSHILSLSHQTGRYQLRGTALSFQVDGRTPVTFEGSLSGDTASISLYGEELRFRRSGEAAVPTVAGLLPLVDRRDQALPVDGVAPAPAQRRTCQVAIDGGTLSLMPDAGTTARTGRFRLTNQLRETCAGQANTPRDEMGTYEQVVDTLVLAADLGPNVVHRFHGSIEPTQVVLHIGGEGDLVFRR